MAKSIHRLSTVVTCVRDVCLDAREIELRDPDDWELPLFTPGAHVDVHLPGGLIRQYSLCGRATDRKSYFIAVRKDEQGRGGSIAAHRLEVGDEVLLSLPRNLFPLEEAPRTVMVAGGIGITPFLPMLHQLVHAGRDHHLHYASRSPQLMPFYDDIMALPGAKVSYYHSNTGSRLNLQELCGNLRPDDRVYCCGPERMIAEMRDLAEANDLNLSYEHFGVDADPAQKAYEIHLKRSGRTIPVNAGQTMLEALRLASVDVPASCEGGICLDCKTRYLAGSPNHRDITLPAEERSTHLTPCVSGCDSDRITLDL